MIFFLLHISHKPELSLSRQLGFRENAHVDEVSTPLAIHDALRAGRELRALHAHNSLVSEELEAFALRI